MIPAKPQSSPEQQEAASARGQQSLCDRRQGREQSGERSTMTMTSVISDLLFTAIISIMVVLVIVPLTMFVWDSARRALRLRNRLVAGRRGTTVSASGTPTGVRNTGGQRLMRALRQLRSAARKRGRLDNRRRHVRVGTDLRGYVAGQARLRHCEILDLSLAGARLRCAAPLEPGHPLILGIGRFGMIAGEVVWSRSNITGIKYTDRFPVVRSVLAPLLPEPCLAG
jgi:hypothetical protein